MGEKFQNRYRISSARLKNWDYRSNGMYFITICCHSRVHHFGEVVNGSMRLSDTGKICDDYLNAIPAHFPFVLLDAAAVVMPDHLHAIVVIDGGDKSDSGEIGGDVACNVSVRPSAMRQWRPYPRNMVPWLRLSGRLNRRSAKMPV